MLAVINATLIDGTGKAPEHGAAVLIDRQRILDAGKNINIPEHVQTIDARGKFVIPGLSDAHTHFGGSDSFGRPGLVGRFAGYDYADSRARCLKWGVTAVRSAGDYMEDMLTLRAEADSGETDAPHICVSSLMLQARGGHPLNTVYFGNGDIGKNACLMVDGTENIRESVAEMAKAGVDWIKLFYSDYDPMSGGAVPKLSREQMRCIVEAAHSNALPVLAHVDSVSDVEDAVDAGVDSIEHIMLSGRGKTEISDALAERAAQKGTWFVPTLGINYLLGRSEKPDCVYNRHLRAVKKLLQAGAGIGVGCDSGCPGVPFGECVHSELEHLVEAGMTPMQALCAATGENAKLLRRDDAFGTIRPGKYADILLLDKNPLEDIRNSRSICMVLLKGRIVSDHFLSCPAGEAV